MSKTNRVSNIVLKNKKISNNNNNNPLNTSRTSSKSSEHITLASCEQSSPVSGLTRAARTYSAPRHHLNTQEYHHNVRVPQRNVTTPDYIDGANMLPPGIFGEIESVQGTPKLSPAKSSYDLTAYMKKNRSVCTARTTFSASRTHLKIGRRDSQPPQDRATYQSLDVTRFPSNLLKRGPRRRAVVVGVNYVLTPDILLRGSCNDAAAMALALINLCSFCPEDVILLVDAFPAACYRQTPQREGERPGSFVSWKNREPSRRNILLALNWLRTETMPGDVLLFYFAGHGIQVDDMSGWEGEGYDEAILPMDFYGEEINAITAVMIKNLLLNVANDVQVTMILDCNGGQTMLDPSGTGKWNFIKGVKQRGVWPFVTDATDKVARAIYDQTPWMDKTMKKRGARPRFVPGAEVSSTQELLDPTLQKPSAQVAIKVKGYLFAAAPWSQSSIEAKMSAVRITPIDQKNNVIRKECSEKHYAYHGVFTWCFITALQELLVQSVQKTQTKAVPYRRLLTEIERRIKACKSPQGGLPKLNQHPELTFYRSGESDGRDFFLWPFGGRRQGVNYVDLSTVSNIQYPCIPHEQQYLSIWEAEEQLRRLGENRRKNDPAFILRNSPFSTTNVYPYKYSDSEQQRIVNMQQPPNFIHNYQQDSDNIYFKPNSNQLLASTSQLLSNRSAMSSTTANAWNNLSIKESQKMFDGRQEQNTSCPPNKSYFYKNYDEPRANLPVVTEACTTLTRNIIVPTQSSFNGPSYVKHLQSFQDDNVLTNTNSQNSLTTTASIDKFTQPSIVRTEMQSHPISSTSEKMSMAYLAGSSTIPSPSLSNPIIPTKNTTSFMQPIQYNNVTYVTQAENRLLLSPKQQSMVVKDHFLGTTRQVPNVMSVYGVNKITSNPINVSGLEIKKRIA